MKDSPEPWITMSEVAAYLSVTPETIRTWIKKKQLPAIKPGKSWLFKKSEIDKWLDGESALEHGTSGLAVDGRSISDNVVSISLFSGAGGLDVASFMAGVPVVLSTDFDSDCIETLRLNPEYKDTQILHGDLHEIESEVFT